MIDLEFEPDQLAIANSIEQFCADRCDADRIRRESGRFSRELWGELAELGMLAIGSPEGGGGALEMAAAMEALGRHVFPGPLIGTFLAGQVLDAEDRERVCDGSLIVSVGSPPLLPFASDADRFLEIAGEQVHAATPASEIEEVETLGGEPWGRVQLDRGPAYARGPVALVFADIAHAAYQAGAGDSLVVDASVHARTRTQFGRAIGEFQAVAHPLADCSMDLAAARLLARNAAFLFDEAGEGESLAGARVMACAAKVSANRAALAAANVCHQVFGANGVTLEGPVFHITRRIRQLAASKVQDPTTRDVLLSSIGFEGAGQATGRAAT